METFHAIDSRVLFLRQEVQATEARLQNLKAQLHEAETQATKAREVHKSSPASNLAESAENHRETLQEEVLEKTVRNNPQGPALWDVPSAASKNQRLPLKGPEYQRYGRQLIMSEVGLHGQLRLKEARVLIVGVGGLGCPAAAYLAGAGVGTLGLVDGDTVEVSNLHRQIAHNTSRLRMNKADSAGEYLASLNPAVKCYRYRFHLSSKNAISIFEKYDLVLDCTDHPTSRYLVSDACILTGKPLVSASALKTEGQLVVLNHPPRAPGDLSGGLCYRCIFPKPPPADSVLSCSQGGILGPVVGVMGVLQALEAIKILTSKPKVPDGTADTVDDSVKPSLLMFSAYSNPQFRSVRLRSRRADCAACSTKATVTRRSLESGSLDYVAFCGITSPVQVLPPEARVSATDFSRLPRDGSSVLIDVRDQTQFGICALEDSINVPWNGNTEAWLTLARQTDALAEDGKQRYVVCQLGNDSQLVAQAIMEHSKTPVLVKDIRGGLKAWREEVDPQWPDY